MHQFQSNQSKPSVFSKNREHGISFIFSLIGKSSFDNRILGERQFDITISSHSEISNQCKVGFHNLSRENKNLIVIDTPGFETNQEVIERSIQVTITDKTHVLLLVLDLDPVVTIEEEKFIELLIQTYGKILFQYFIVVFTFIEQIQDEIDNPINERNIPVLKSLLEQCNIRYIAVNSNSNSEEKEIFLRKLMKIQKVVVVTGF